MKNLNNHSLFLLNCFVLLLLPVFAKLITINSYSIMVVIQVKMRKAQSSVLGSLIQNIIVIQNDDSKMVGSSEKYKLY